MSKQPGEVRIALDLWRAQREGAVGLARRQELRLASLVEYARANSPFYQRLYRDLPVSGLKLRDLPPINKPDLMAAFDEWVTSPRITLADVEAFVADPLRVGTPYRGEFFVCESSGTTGRPGLFVHDRGAIAVYRAITLIRVDFAWPSLRDLLTLARRGLRWASVLGAGGHFAGAGWIELERSRGKWHSRAYRVFSVQSPLSETVKALDVFDPTVLLGYPSALELLAAEQIEGRLHLHPVFVASGGESLGLDATKGLAAAFDCPIYDLLSASEFQALAIGCAHNWLHVNSDWGILEPVDEDFRPTLPGVPSHTVLLTNLANRIQPIIRYDLGDSVLARPDPCPCGSPFPAIRVAGRHDDVLRLHAANGRIVSVLPLAIGIVVEKTPGIHRGQIIQTGPSMIRLRLEPKPGADVEKLWQDVVANLRSYLTDQDLANVELVRANEPPEQNPHSGKFRQVIAVQPNAGL